MRFIEKLDGIDSESDLNGFKVMLEDRFGPVLKETEELLQTIRLRWLSRILGMEKVILKSEVLIAAFVSDEDESHTSRGQCLPDFKLPQGEH